MSAANDPVFWHKLRELADPEVTFELVSNERDKPYYTELVDMNELKCIGDNLTLLTFADKSIMIFMVPSQTGLKMEYFIPNQDFVTLNALGMLDFVKELALKQK